MASQDYSYRDVDGGVINIPTSASIYTETSPGPWKDLIKQHIPVLTPKIRKEGLELIRILEFEITHAGAEEKNTVKGITVADKDGLVIGYAAFLPKTKNLKAKMTINGVINYIEVYVECTEHGVWKKTFRL